MALLLTLLFDLLMIILFLFRMIKGDQIIFIVSIILQGLIFIDLLAVVLLGGSKKPKTVDVDITEMTRRQSRQSTSPKRGGFFFKIFLRCRFAVTGILHLFCHLSIYLTNQDTDILLVFFCNQFSNSVLFFLILI
ncbi:hypothetical protein ABW365_22360 [Enterococcus avium]